MKTMLKFSTLVLIAGLIIGLTGCPTKNDDGKNNGGGEDDAIFKENAAGRLITANLGAEDLVLFYDSVKNANLLGGLPANADQFKIKLPDSNKMYVIYAVRYSDYKGKSSAEIPNLKVIDSTLVYSDLTEETGCRIGDPKSGGEGEFKFRNQTNYFIEVGDDSPSESARFFVMQPYGDASVFVEERKDGYRLCLTLFLPMRKSGKIIGVQRQYVDKWTKKWDPRKGGPEEVTVSPELLVELKPNYEDGYLRVINNYGEALSVRNGSTPKESTIGKTIIKNGEEQVFEFSGNNDTPGRPYAQFRFVAGQIANDIAISEFYIQNGYKYTLTLNPASSTPKYTISEGTPLVPNAEEITW